MTTEPSQSIHAQSRSTRRPKYKTTITLPELKWLALLVVPAMIQPWTDWTVWLGSPGMLANTLMTVFGMGIQLYAMWLVGRVHQIMAQTSRNRYEIRPVKAVLRHLWPVYSLWWCAQWTDMLAQRLRAPRGGQLVSRNALLWSYILANSFYINAPSGIWILKIPASLAPLLNLAFIMILQCLVMQHVVVVSVDENPRLDAVRVPSNWGWRVYLGLYLLIIVSGTIAFFMLTSR